MGTSKGQQAERAFDSRCPRADRPEAWIAASVIWSSGRRSSAANPEIMSCVGIKGQLKRHWEGRGCPSPGANSLAETVLSHAGLSSRPPSHPRPTAPWFTTGVNAGSRLADIAIGVCPSISALGDRRLLGGWGSWRGRNISVGNNKNAQRGIIAVIHVPLGPAPAIRGAAYHRLRSSLRGWRRAGRPPYDSDSVITDHSSICSHGLERWREGGSQNVQVSSRPGHRFVPFSQTTVAGSQHRGCLGRAPYQNLTYGGERGQTIC
ncbi:hypothetical protein GQ53DRAFT_362347 [Thozetella sp. PMI_491]|nr:hypothetical protein GQ53DRAFT_362347 [Thozetella sp. PMI_491]